MKTLFYMATLMLLIFSINSCTDSDSEITRGSLIPAKFELPYNNTSAQKGQIIRVEVSVADIDLVKSIKVYTKVSVIYERKVSNASHFFEVNTDTWSYGTSISIHFKKVRSFTNFSFVNNRVFGEEKVSKASH